MICLPRIGGCHRWSLQAGSSFIVLPFGRCYGEACASSHFDTPLRQRSPTPSPCGSWRRSGSIALRDDLLDSVASHAHREEVGTLWRVCFEVEQPIASKGVVASDEVLGAKGNDGRYTGDPRAQKGCAGSSRRDERKRLREAKIPNLLGNRHMFLRNFEDLPPGDHIIDTLDIALGQHPIVKEAYTLKEKFRDVWKAKTRAEAEAVYDEWAHNAIDSKCALCFAPVIRAVSNWREEIFAYHDVQLTNAYTESFNAVIRKMNRAGNGYSFEALKKRLLMAHGLGFREAPGKLSFCFREGKWFPWDLHRYERQIQRRRYPVRERPVIGFRLSTLARLVGKLPLN